LRLHFLYKAARVGGVGWKRSPDVSKEKTTMERQALACRAWAAGILLGLSPVGAVADDGLVFECDRYDGEQSFKIYINEAEGYVLYNAQTRGGDYSRKREYSMPENEDGKTVVLDDGLDIYQNDRQLIRASSQDSSFVLAKETATYAYAWTTPFPRGDGKLVAFGNHHTGRCLQSRWQ